MKEVHVRVTRTRVALIAVAIAIAATSSIGWAAIGDGGTVQGCVANNGTIDAIDPVTQACRDRQTPVEWYTKAGADTALLNAGEATSVSGYQVLERSVTLPRADMGTASNAVSCPAGKRIINVINNGPGVVLPRAHGFAAHSDNPTTWTVYGSHDFSPDYWTSTVYVVCIDAT